MLADSGGDGEDEARQEPILVGGLALLTIGRQNSERDGDGGEQWLGKGTSGFQKPARSPRITPRLRLPATAR